jgi:hypothetical protein
MGQHKGEVGGREGGGEGLNEGEVVGRGLGGSTEVTEEDAPHTSGSAEANARPFLRPAHLFPPPLPL